MCGRYSAAWEPTKFHEQFKVQPPLFESFNVAPTQQAPIIRQLEEVREVQQARWALLPHWVGKPSDFKVTLFNARSESLLDKASFKRPFKSQRCLVPVSSYYEWGADKQPYYVHSDDGKPFGLAGLWDHWEKHGQAITSFTIITTEPNERMRALHHRMPAVLSPEDYEAWLSPESQPDELESLLHATDLDYYPVDKRVGSVRNNDPSLTKPLISAPKPYLGR